MTSFRHNMHPGCCNPYTIPWLTVYPGLGQQDHLKHCPSNPKKHSSAQTQILYEVLAIIVHKMTLKVTYNRLLPFNNLISKTNSLAIVELTDNN